MTAYRVGDIPANPDVFDVPEEIDVTGYTDVDGTLTDPAGEDVTLAGESFTLGMDDNDAPIITVVWGTSTPFADPGLYQLSLKLTDTGVQQTLASIPIVVEQEDGWLTISELRKNWRDAPDDDEDCFELLEVAKAGVVAFAPALAEGAQVPATYRKGQRMQARNTWNAAKVDPTSGGMGDDTFVIRPYPLDWAIKQVLRPKPAIPPVG